MEWFLVGLWLIRDKLIKALKWVLRYLNGFLKLGLRYKKTTQGGDAIKVYVDANSAGNVDIRKTLYGYVFTLYGNAISLKANL